MAPFAVHGDFVAAVVVVVVAAAVVVVVVVVVVCRKMPAAFANWRHESKAICDFSQQRTG